MGLPLESTFSFWSWGPCDVNVCASRRDSPACQAASDGSGHPQNVRTVREESVDSVQSFPSTQRERSEYSVTLCRVILCESYEGKNVVAVFTITFYIHREHTAENMGKAC